MVQVVMTLVLLASGDHAGTLTNPVPRVVAGLNGLFDARTPLSIRFPPARERSHADSLLLPPANAGRADAHS